MESVDGDGSGVSNDHLLVRELTHRVTNEFASVIGLVSLIAARSTNDDVKDSLSSVMNLLHNYAGAHRALQNSEIAHRFGPEGARSIIIFPNSSETPQINSPGSAGS